MDFVKNRLAAAHPVAAFGVVCAPLDASFVFSPLYDFLCVVEEFVQLRLVSWAFQSLYHIQRGALCLLFVVGADVHIIVPHRVVRRYRGKRIKSDGSILARAAPQQSAAVYRYHRTFRIAQLVDGFLGLRRGPQVDPRLDTSVRRMAAPQPQHPHESSSRHRQSHDAQNLAPPHAPDVEHRQRQHEDQHGRRGVRRHDHQTRQHDGKEYREAALAPYAPLLGPAPGPELETRHDLQRAYGRLPFSELVGQVHHDGELEHLRRLELESHHRDPAGGAVCGLPREVDEQRQQQRHHEEQVREAAVCLAVYAVHEEYGADTHRQHRELRAQELRRGRIRTGVVCHLRRGRIYHQHRDDHQRDDDHPQHPVAAEETAHRGHKTRTCGIGLLPAAPAAIAGAIRAGSVRSSGRRRHTHFRKLLLLVHTHQVFIVSPAAAVTCLGCSPAPTA